MVEGSHEIPSFSYTSGDVVSALEERKESRELQSSLETLLCERWDLAMSRGAFRYDLTGVTTRRVAGSHGFVLQCNPKRSTHRRMPANMTSLVQPFDPALFNFNKIKPEEVLFELCCGREAEQNGGKPAEEGEGQCCSCSVEEGEWQQRHLIVVNVSPITYGHALVIPQPEACLPQVWTCGSIQLCLDLVALSNPRSGFCMVANSLLAYASVNHLHYHTLFIREPVLASTVRGVHLKGGVYTLSDHPSPAFGFQVSSSSTAASARLIYLVVELLLKSGVAHNMVILWGSPFHPEEGSGSPVVRAVLVPRKPIYGEKVLPGTDGSPFAAAACELVQGFIPVSSERSFQTLTEDDIIKCLQDKMLPQEKFQLLQKELEQIL